MFIFFCDFTFASNQFLCILLVYDSSFLILFYFVYKTWNSYSPQQFGNMKLAARKETDSIFLIGFSSFFFKPRYVCMSVYVKQHYIFIPTTRRNEMNVYTEWMTVGLYKIRYAIRAFCNQSHLKTKSSLSSLKCSSWRWIQQYTRGISYERKETEIRNISFFQNYNFITKLLYTLRAYSKDLHLIKLMKHFFKCYIPQFILNFYFNFNAIYRILNHLPFI